MKLATFNINNVNKRPPNLLASLKSGKPDIVCLQELRLSRLPNGNPQPGPKFDCKLAWLDRLIRHARTLKKLGAPVALVGDYNAVPTDFDIYQTRS